MRYFIALEIPSENIPQFQSIQSRLHTLIPQVKLTDLDKIHLTLAFIGEQSDNLLPSLIQVLQDAARNISAFEVTPAYIDGFPDIHYPKVLWVGVKGDIDKLMILRERIKDGLSDLNLPVDERRFTPHITLAKLKNPINVSRDLESNLEHIISDNLDSVKITSIKLFESVPDHGFHSHNTLAEVELKST